MEDVTQYKQHWGNPCDRHENVAAWMAQVQEDDEGLFCFGCFIESRERAAADAALEEAAEIAEVSHHTSVDTSDWESTDQG